MTERDIWIAANEMIKAFGDEAGLHAAVRADALRDQGDEEGYAIWARVVAAIKELRDISSGGKPH
jgi:hypothetical protein